MAVIPDGPAPAVEALAQRLAERCQNGDHWTYDAVAELCGLAQEDLAAAVKSWWGQREPWLDLLATEFVRCLGQRMGMDRQLGPAWEHAVEAWADEAYTAAAAAPDAKPPQRSVLFSRAKPAADRFLGRLSGDAPTQVSRQTRQPAGFRPAARGFVQLCPDCGRPRVEKMGRCVACPPKPQQQHQQQVQSQMQAQAQVPRMQPQRQAAPRMVLRNRGDRYDGPPPCDRCRRPISLRLGRCVNCTSGAPPEPEPQPQPQPQRRSSSTSSSSSSSAPPDPEQLMQEWRSCPSAPLEESSWSDLSDVLWARGGSGGVGLLRRSSGIVCLKKCCPEELFAQRLAKALSVRVADMRIVDSGEDEASQLRGMVRSVAATAGDGAKVPVRGILRFDVLCLVEFLDGVGMMGMPAHEYLKTLQASADVAKWRQLGRLCAFDMLINNLDRLPLAWTNEGNLTNVLIGGAAGAFVGIDQSAAPILFEAGLQGYLSRVKQAVKEAGSGEAAAFGRVMEAIYNNTAIQLSSEEKAELRRGCWEFAQEVAALARDEKLEPLLKEVGDEVKGHFAGRQKCDEVVTNVSAMVQRVASVMMEECGK